MTTFKNLVTSSLYRVGEDVDDTDDDVLQVIKDGINEGYSLLALKADPRTNLQSYTYAKELTLPEDFIKVVNIENSVVGDLSPLDYEIIANLLYIRSKDAQIGTITLKYMCLPTPLVNDTDTFNLKINNVQALVVYAAYSYYVYRKKTEAAANFLNQFYLITGLKELKAQNET